MTPGREHRSTAARPSRLTGVSCGRRNPSPTSEAGFLLVEALAAVVLVGIMFALFASLASVMSSRDATLTKQAYLSVQSRAGTDGELTPRARVRHVQRYDAARSPRRGRRRCSSRRRTRQQPFHLRQFTYSLTNGVFTRPAIAASTNTDGPPWTIGATGSAATIVDSITNPSVFRYYDSTGARS